MVEKEAQLTGDGVFEVGAGQVERSEIPTYRGCPAYREWIPYKEYELLLLENRHLPRGGKFACGQMIEIDTARHLLTELVPSIPIDCF